MRKLTYDGQTFEYGSNQQIYIGDNVPDYALIDWGNGFVDTVGQRRDLYTIAQNYLEQNIIDYYISPTQYWRNQPLSQVSNRLLEVAEDFIDENQLALLVNDIQNLTLNNPNAPENAPTESGNGILPWIVAGAIAVMALS